MEATTSPLNGALRGTPFLIGGVALVAVAVRTKRRDVPRKSWLAMGLASLAFGACFEVKATTDYWPGVIAGISQIVFVVVSVTIASRDLSRWRDRRKTADKT